MDELMIPQFWGNGRVFHRAEDVRTEDDYETVVVQLRDSEGYRYGRVRMSREAALELAEYLISAARLKETVMEARRAGRRRISPIDATPAAEARKMGFEMTNMAVLHESVNGSRQDAPVHDVTRQDVYVKVMAALHRHYMPSVDAYLKQHSRAELRELIQDVITSFPDEIVLHISDLWDDGRTLECAREYLYCAEMVWHLRDDVRAAEEQIGREAA
jgi:hypothetical protein